MSTPRAVRALDILRFESIVLSNHCHNILGKRKDFWGGLVEFAKPSSLYMPSIVLHFLKSRSISINSCAVGSDLARNLSISILMVQAALTYEIDLVFLRLDRRDMQTQLWK